MQMLISTLLILNMAIGNYLCSFDVQSAPSPHTEHIGSEKRFLQTIFFFNTCEGASVVALEFFWIAEVRILAILIQASCFLFLFNFFGTNLFQFQFYKKNINSKKPTSWIRHSSGKSSFVSTWWCQLIIIAMIIFFLDIIIVIFYQDNVSSSSGG